MKKLLILALIANVAMAENEFVADMKDLGSDIGGQFAEAFTIPAEAVKDVSVRVATNIKDASKTAAAKIKETAKDTAEVIKESDAADVAIQFAAFPVQVAEGVRDGFNASVDATRNFGRKIADSSFVARVKDGTKKAVTKIKDTAHDIAHSEAVDDAKDVFEQFASAPKEAWLNIAAFFTAVKSELVD